MSQTGKFALILITSLASLACGGHCWGYSGDNWWGDNWVAPPSWFDSRIG